MVVALLPSPVLQFCDGNGDPYAGGSIATYIPGTSTPVTTWNEPTGTVANTNPVILDAAGRCTVYASGGVRMVLTDALGNLVFDQPSNALVVSAAMLPVVAAATIAAAQALLGIFANPVSAAMQPVTGAATLALAQAAMGLRVRLAAALNLYVSPSGSDANNGLAAGTPFATIAHAKAVLYQSYDHNGFTPTINLAAGTYTEVMPNWVGLPCGAFAVNITGNPATPASVVLAPSSGPCVLAGYAANMLVSGVTFTASGGYGPYSVGGVALSAYNGAEINFTACIFGACTVAHLEATAGATVSSLGQPYTITGGAEFHIASNEGGVVVVANQTVTLVGTPAFETFAAADGCGNIYAAGFAFTGSATGYRYHATSGGVIETNGGGANVFPGNIPGVTDPIGVYT
jgi:hypothetical protein